MDIIIDYNNDEIRIENDPDNPDAVFKGRNYDYFPEIISEILNRCVPMQCVSLIEINEDVRTIKEEW